MPLNGNIKIQNYINHVCSQIKFSEAHHEVKLELMNHIEEITLDYVSQGLTEDKAVDKAIVQMGDATLVGKQLNQIHKPTINWSILLLTLSFAGFGLLSLYFIETKMSSEYSHVFSKGLIFTLLGIAISIVFYFLDYRKIKVYSKYIYLGTILTLLFMMFRGTPINGAIHLSLGSMAFNFAGIAPFLLIISLAGMFDSWNWAKSINYLHAFLLMSVPMMLLLAIPSFSAAVIYAIAFVILAIISGAKFKYVLWAIAFYASMFIFVIMSSSYRAARFLMFLNPSQDPNGMGWQSMQLAKHIQSAGLFGQGFTFKPNALPEVHTDFVFTYILFTFGWITGIILAALVITFLIRMAYITKVINNRYAKLLIGGLTAIFAVQFVWNILMNIGYAPLSGVGLPFISYGGSHCIINMAAVGMILSIYRRKSLSDAPTDMEKPLFINKLFRSYK